jgi:hypothetical protein
LLLSNKKWLKLLVQIALIVTIMYDFKHFSADVLKYRITKWNQDSGLTFPFYYDGRRVLDERTLVQGMKPLLRNVYTPYGYSQFIDINYINFFDNLNLGNSVRASFTKDYARPNLDFALLKKYGITYVRTRKEEYVLRNPSNSSLLRDELPSQYLLLKDGHIIMEIESPSEKLFTTIKFDRNWNTLMNGRTVKPNIWDNQFMEFDVTAGKNIAEFRYIPYDLYFGLIMGTIVIFSSYFLIKSIKIQPNQT